MYRVFQKKPTRRKGEIQFSNLLAMTLPPVLATVEIEETADDIVTDTDLYDFSASDDKK